MSQLALVLLLALCVAILPKFAFESNEGGVTNYGVQAKTVVPFTLAFSLSALLLWQSARALPGAIPERRRVQLGLEVTAAMLGLVLVSTFPFKVNGVFNTLHFASAALLAAAQGVFLTWMVFTLRRRARDISLWLVWVAGVAVAGLTIAGVVHLLMVAQVTMALGFAGVTCSIVSELVSAPGTTQRQLATEPTDRGGLRCPP